MTQLSELEIQILRKIKPTSEEYKLVWDSFEAIASIVREVLTQNNVSADITLQGSIAHDTWLSGDRDLDIFVLFPSSWTREDIERKGFQLLLEAAKRIGQYELRYAEHPYVRIKFGAVEADIVPALKLYDLSEVKTSVDRTPFHTRYVNSALNSEQKDHVRLLKRFMKAIGVYGAETKVHGFSGYAVELLVAVYGDFKSVLKEASTWRPPVFVNTLGEKLTDTIRRAVISRYPNSCIYMPDPVDPMRNVGASISLKSLATFIIASWCYTRNPGIEFFTDQEELSLEDLVALTEGRCILLIKYNLPKMLPPDVIWGEAQRVASRLVGLLKVLNITVLDFSVWSNDKNVVVIAVELESCKLNNYKLYRGPCITHERDRIWNFIQTHLGRGYGPWIDTNGCLNSLDERRTNSVVELIESRWGDFTVAPHLRSVRPEVETVSKEAVVKLLNEGAGRWLSEFALKTPKWMARCTS